MIDTTHFFMESIDLRKHPVKKSKEKIRVEYYNALSYIVNYAVENAVQTESDNKESQIIASGAVIHSETFKKYITSRLELYKKQLLISNMACDYQNEIQKKDALRSVSACIARPWRKKYRFWLICDISLILLDHAIIDQAAAFIKSHLSKRQKKKFDIFFSSLYDSNADISKFSFAEDIIKQYRINDAFTKKPLRKIIVTANMSAGKSMLINALIGKPLARTSQEVCTGNLCYMHNKPYEDGLIYLAASGLNLDACSEDLHSYPWQSSISISSYFTGVNPLAFPLCIIDTPGVNAALYKDHIKVAHQALSSHDYDKLLYVISPTSLGTDAEIKHLKWVSDHVPKGKAIFVLNKLDDFNSNVDNISESIEALHSDLLKLGFEKPVICPISAYFGLLLKMKLTSQEFTEDEQDEYDRLSKKFGRPQYDLSPYYEEVQCFDSEAEELKLCKKSGIYGLEKYIYGGFT